MATRHSLDRSTMFSILLTLSTKYGQLESKAGEAVTTAVLAAWYDSTATDMFKFAKEWITANRKDLLPLKA